MPVSLVAIKNMRYEGRPYVAGDAFQARDASDAMVLKLTKLAKDAPVPVAAPVPVVEAAPEPQRPSAEPDSDAETNVVDPDSVRRTYHRADLSAEAKAPRRRTSRADVVAEE